MTSRRMIDPAIWQSESLAQLTRLQRLFFIGLFSNADDQGRLRAHPALLRSTIYPFDDIPLEEIVSDLDALQAIGCIWRYDVEDKPCLQIVNWWKYQSPQWAYPSKIPAPDGWHDRLRYRQDDAVKTDNWPTKEQPEPLPNALPKDLGEDSAEPLDCDHRVRVSTSPSLSLSSAVVSPTAAYVWRDETGQGASETEQNQLDKLGGDDIPLFRECIHIYKERYTRARSVKLDVVLDWVRKGGPPGGDVEPPARASPPEPPPREARSPTNGIGQVWLEAYDELSRQMTKGAASEWLGGAVLDYGATEDEVVLTLRNEYALDWVESRWHVPVQRTLSGILGHNVKVAYVAAV